MLTPFSSLAFLLSSVIKKDTLVHFFHLFFAQAYSQSITAPCQRTESEVGHGFGLWCIKKGFKILTRSS